jgi:hypothetical protein
MSDYGPLLIILMIIIKATVRTGQVSYVGSETLSSR